MQSNGETTSAFARISQGKTVKKIKQREVEDVDDAGVEIDDGDSANEPDEDEESPFRDPPEGCVRLRPSQFHGIPATVFVEYPPELSVRRADQSVIEPLGQRKLGYKSYWERICIKNAHCRAGFQKSEKFWTSLWSKHQNAEQMRELNCLQKINHFPASWCIGRKDRLTRTLNMMKRVHGANGSLFDIHPETFILPGERESLGRLIKSEISAAANATNRTKSFNSTTAAMSAQGGMWIVKPCASSCGQGIKVMTGLQAAALAKKKKAVVQRYLARPYLIDGRKFDLRIYVLVSGVDPLRVYIHDEGLTRISTAKYTLKNLTNNFAHLTNYSINKNAPNFKAAEFNMNPNATSTASASGDGDDDDVDAPDGNVAKSGKKPPQLDPEMEGFKWSLAAFRRWLAQREGREVMEQTFDRIFDLCLKAVIAAEGEITPHLHSSAQYRTNCFELFGCDVILDSDLRPHLLEVNVSPSLMGSSPLDKKIKGLVIADLLHIVGLYPHDPSLLKKYDTNNSNGTAFNAGGTGSSKGSTKTTLSATGGSGNSSGDGNPFAFNSLSKMMAAQDRYRRSPSVETIDIPALGDTEASWMLLLMAEDELLRAKSSKLLLWGSHGSIEQFFYRTVLTLFTGKFHCVHPTPSNAVYYTGLYRSVRFSDHLLAHWVLHGGSRGKYGKCIPHKYRPVNSSVAAAGKVTSPVKGQSSFQQQQQRLEYSGGTSTGNRARAKSAGRTTSATQRGSTYNPSSLLQASAAAPPAEKIRGSLANTYSSEPHMSNSSETHASRRRLHEEQQLQQANGDVPPEGRTKARGKSEPRKKSIVAQAQSPQPSPRLIPKQAFLSPSARPALLPTTPSSVRSRLESGISQAAFYSAGIADLSLSPEEGRGAHNSKDRATDGKKRSGKHQQQASQYDEEMTSQQSVGEKDAHSSFSPSPSPSSRTTNSTAHTQRNTQQTTAMLQPDIQDSQPAGRGQVRPSTSSSTLGRSDSAGSLRLEQSLLNAKANGSMNSMSSGPEDAYSLYRRSPTPELTIQNPHTQTKGNTFKCNDVDSIDGSSTRVVSTTPPPRVAADLMKTTTRAEPVLVPSPSLDVRSSSRPLLSEFAAFNEQIRARASASREGTRAYIINSSNHRAASPGNNTGSTSNSNTQYADSPLKQRRVSLVKTKSEIPASVSTASVGGGSKVGTSSGLQHGSNHSHASRTRSKQELLEEVHRTLFAQPTTATAAVGGASAGGSSVSSISPNGRGGGGSHSRSPLGRRNNPLDPMQLQPAYQIAAHPSFSQPISSINNNSINKSSGIDNRAAVSLEAQQNRAFAKNPAVMTASAASSGKIIQYGNPSSHPGSSYSK